MAWLRSILLVHLLFPLCLFLLECQIDENRSTVDLSRQSLPRTGLGAPGRLAAEVLEPERQIKPAPVLVQAEGGTCKGPVADGQVVGLRREWRREAKCH